MTGSKLQSDQALASIIIPCHNGERYVGEAIESALTQTYPNIEVVVIDDGSTDDSLKVIRSFGNRVRWESGTNRGACAARNRGIELARGKLVQFLDADDLLFPEKIEMQVKHSASLDEQTVSICLGHPSKPDKFLEWQYARLYEPSTDPVEFALGGILPTTAPLHRRTLLRQVGGFDEVLPCAQEFDLHLRLVCSGVMLCQLREVLFTVRRQSRSISSDGTKVIRQKRYILDKARVVLESRREFTAARQQKMAIILAHAATHLELFDDKNAAALCWRDAYSLSPDAAVLSWSPRWRPLVRLVGSANLARMRYNWRTVLSFVFCQRD